MSPSAVEMLANFLNQLRFEKRASVHTVSNYQRDLGHLSAYCKDKLIVSWVDLKQHDIRAHIAARHRKGLGSKSLQRELSAIRSFYAFLLKNNLTDSNPAQHIKAPKQDRKLPKTLDVDQINGFLEAGASSLLEIRDLAMFELFYSSGLRLSELSALDMADLDLFDRSLIVRSGKGGKSRILPIGSKAVIAINNWLQVRSKLCAIDNTPVFITTKRHRLAPRSIELRLSLWCIKKA